MKNLTEDGLEKVDGRVIEIYEAKFVNVFEMNLDDAVGLSDGDVGTMLVTFRVETPKFTSVRKTGQLKRQNQLRITESTCLDPDKAQVLYDAISKPISGVNMDLVTVTKINTEQVLGFNPEELE